MMLDPKTRVERGDTIHLSNTERGEVAWFESPFGHVHIEDFRALLQHGVIIPLHDQLFADASSQTYATPVYSTMIYALAVLRSARVRTQNEACAQADIADALSRADIPFEAESRLDENSRIDFLLDHGVGIECKVKGQARAIYRQMQRYAANERIAGLILATGKPMGLPTTIGNKPTRLHTFGSAWL